MQFDSRQYIAGPGPAATIHPSQLGPVITHIQCSLAASDDHRHVGMPLVNGSAAYLPAGSAVFAVRGYSPRCRLAGYVDGHLHVYLAQVTCTANPRHFAAPCDRFPRQGEHLASPTIPPHIRDLAPGRARAAAR